MAVRPVGTSSCSSVGRARLRTGLIKTTRSTAIQFRSADDPWAPPSR